MSNLIERPIVAYTLLTIIAVLWIALFFVLIYFASPKKGDIIRIDCRLSEISPDIPIWAKEACRKARIEKIDTEPK